MYLVFFFFFQAEDGIRDVAVTGVQTCALPISNFPLQNEFPIFIENVLAWFNREQIALGRSPENLVNPNLSNINRSIFTAPSSTQRAVWFRRELWFYMIVSAVALIALEWFTYHRGITF